MALRGLHVNERNFLNRIDIRLVLLIFCLNVIGLFNLYSATHGPHSKEVESLFIQQIVWLLGGWTLFFILTFLQFYSPSSSSPSLLILTFSCVLSCTLFSISHLPTTFRLNLFFSSWMKRAMPSLFRPLLSSRKLKVSVRKMKGMLTVQIISMLLN